MDAYRHINNSAYLAYLEQARVAMFFHRHEGFSTGTVISRHEIDYLRPVVTAVRATLVVAFSAGWLAKTSAQQTNSHAATPRLAAPRASDAPWGNGTDAGIG